MFRFMGGVVALALSSILVAAPCPAPNFTAASEVSLSRNEAMIVTHPSTQWDGRFSSKMGMDAAVQFAKKRNIPVVYLQDSSLGTTNGTYFFADCNPDYSVASSGGEFSFQVAANHIYSVGGHWEYCQKTTMHDLMRSWSTKTEDLKITQVMDGLYTAGSYFSSSDAYYNDFKRFMEILTFNNPRPYWYITKLSLLESMGIIKDRAKRVAFLKRNLPPYSYLTGGYEVVMTVDGVTETLRAGQGANPPRLTLEFVDTLYENGYIPVRTH